MQEPRESRLWLLLGSAFTVGGTILLAADFKTWLQTRQLDAEGFKIGVFCSIAVLAGLMALLAWRIFRNMEHPPLDHGRIVWHLLARIGMPVGAITVEYEWGRTMSIPTTFNEKAVLMMGAFVFLAGVLALVGERVVHHMRELAAFHKQYGPCEGEDVPQDAAAQPASAN